MKYKALTDLPLLDILIQVSPKSSKTTLRSWVKEGRVQVDGLLVKNSNVVVLEGQLVTVGQQKKILKEGIKILYEDKDFVVIDKPATLLSVSTAFEKKETAHGILKDHYYPRRVFVVHRLDQDTSGVMVFALNQHACEQMKDIFEAHDIERSYTAAVEGAFNGAGTWKSYLYEDESYTVHSTSNPDEGEEAITHYQTIRSSKRYSLLHLTLETGKKNQIRVHCRDAGHPIAGDKKYGGHASPIKRLCLHAHLLCFTHPFTKKKLRFESPVPENFYQLLK